MQDATAVKAALQLLHLPASVRYVREAALPLDLVDVLQVAAEDEAAIAAAQQATGRDRQTLISASRFFIEQTLWQPGADNFRVLGADAKTSSSVLKRNMALLMTWLHPDAAKPSDQYSAHIARITAAWNDLKTPERREAYEALLDRELAEIAQRRRQFKSRIAANRERIRSSRKANTSLWQRMWSLVSGRRNV